MKSVFIKLWSNRILFLLSLAGIALSAYMWSYQVTDRIIPCTDSGCSHVLTSDYSHFFGVPVSVFGFFYYIFIALVSFERFFIKHKLLDKLLIAFAAWGIVFSAYLRYLEFAKIGSICIWCWVSVVIILLISTTLFVERRSLRG